MAEADTSTDNDAFAAAVAIVLAHEGAFQDAADDPGNWTGGRVGAGTLKGTKYGISAAQYSTLDIAGLTVDEAAAIYRRDWWDRFGLGALPAAVALKVFDAGVNVGMSDAVTGLQRALRACGHAVVEDGKLGRATVAAAAAVPGEILLPALRETMAGHYRLVAAHDPSMSRFLTGWLARAYA